MCGLNMRTTSSLEALNSAMGRAFPKHPHMFRFIDRLRLLELKKSIDMLDLINNDDINEGYRRKRKRDQTREDKIKYFTEQLKTNQNMTPALFLEAMANKEVLPELGKNMKTQNEKCVKEFCNNSIEIL